MVQVPAQKNVICVCHIKKCNKMYIYVYFLKVWGALGWAVDGVPEIQVVMREKGVQYGKILLRKLTHVSVALSLL